MQLLNNTKFITECIPLQDKEGDCLTVISKGTFIMTPNSIQLAGEQLPLLFGDKFHDDADPPIIKYESDIVPFKPATDILLEGSAHAPRGKKARVLDTILKVGSKTKKVRVFGNRKWVYSGMMIPEYISKPEPFNIIPLTSNRAFGGIDVRGGGYCNENITGTGFFSKKSKKAVNNTPLPNIEHPGMLIKKCMDHPKPTGYGVYARSWAPRLGYAGTYDEKWRKNQSPNLPDDFDYRFYNAAYPDLQVNGFLKGNEDIELLNLSPHGPIKFDLPGFQLSAEVHFNDEKIPEKLSQTMQLDTLCLIPDNSLLYMVWRCRFSTVTRPMETIRKIIIEKSILSRA